MLSVAGILFIKTEPKENPYNKGAYFNFIGIGKYPYSEGKKFYKVSVHVPEEHLVKARKQLRQGEFIQLRLGELDGNLVDEAKETVFNTVKTKWLWIEPLAVQLVKERQAS